METLLLLLLLPRVLAFADEECEHVDELDENLAPDAADAIEPLSRRTGLQIIPR